jgi:hypothetical protein
MNACQLRDPLAKKPDSAAAHRLSISNSDDQKPRGKDQVVARLVSKDRIDFGSRGRPTPVPTNDLLPIGPQGSLSKFGRRINRDHSRDAMRRSHARSLTTEKAIGRTMSNIDFKAMTIEQPLNRGRRSRVTWSSWCAGHARVWLLRWPWLIRSANRYSACLGSTWTSSASGMGSTRSVPVAWLTWLASA